VSANVKPKNKKNRGSTTLTIMDRLIDHDEDFKYHHQTTYKKSLKREDETQTDTKEKIETMMMMMMKNNKLKCLKHSTV
jgi:hypothetical protein